MAKSIPESFKQAGLVTPSLSQLPRLITCLEGENGTGKTEFGLSQVDPLAIVNYDDSLDGVIEKHVKAGKIMRVHNVRISKSTKQEAAQKSLSDLWQKYERWCLDRAVRSIFIDTASELWEHVRLAHFGKLEKIPPIKYTEANADMRRFFDVAYLNGKNLCLSHRMKDEYVDRIKFDEKKGEDVVVSARTGRRERRGFSDMTYRVNLHLRMFKEGNKHPDKFRAEILKCRNMTELEGMEIQGGDISFTAIGQMIFPDAPGSVWV